MTTHPLTGKARDSVELADRRINVWEGSVRSSKTISSLLAWLDYVRNGPPGNLLMAGRTERTLRRNILDPLTEMLGEHRCRYVAGAGELHLLGRRVYVAGANDERAQEKIRGLTLAGAYVDEATTVPESFWSMLLTRLSVKGARLFATTNPDNPAHWLKRDYLDRAATHLTKSGTVARGGDGEDTLDLARFSFQLADNPHLPAAYLAALEAEFTGLWRRRYVLGEWVLAEGAIYDMWDPETHIVTALPRIDRWIAAGVDYGTTNPFAALLVGLGDDGRLYVTQEYRWDSRRQGRQKTDTEYSTDLRGWLARAHRPYEDGQGVTPQWVAVDPSAVSFKVQLHSDGVRSVVDADNTVLDGIRLIGSLLATSRLLVHESCRGLIDELPGYSWDDTKAEKGQDEPVKVNDHSCDALRYALATTEQIWRPHLTPTTPKG